MNGQEYLDAFKVTVDKMFEITKAKNADYSGVGTTDAFKNFKTVELLGVATVEQGFVTRITDKLTRVSNLLTQEARVVDEKMEDTLLDMANYCILFKLYLDTKKNTGLKN